MKKFRRCAKEKKRKEDRWKKKEQMRQEHTKIADRQRKEGWKRKEVK